MESGIAAYQSMSFKTALEDDSAGKPFTGTLTSPHALAAYNRPTTYHNGISCRSCFSLP